MAKTSKRSVYKAVATIKAALDREIATTTLVQDMKKTAEYAEQLAATRQEPEAVNSVWDFIENFEDLTAIFARMDEGLRPALDEFKKEFPGREAA